jgi:hypothetical protein
VLPGLVLLDADQPDGFGVHGRRAPTWDRAASSYAVQWFAASRGHRVVRRARVAARSAAGRADEMSAPPEGRRARTQIWLLVALFFAPLALAFLLYYGGGWRPPGSTNNGELISPPRPVPNASAWHGKWTLVYVGDGRCDERCRAALILTRQTRLALNADMTRVQRIFLATATVAIGLISRRSIRPGVEQSTTTPARRCSGHFPTWRAARLHRRSVGNR